MTIVLSEDFNRSVANQWTGGPFTWTLSGGTVPDDYDLNGTKGLHTHGSTNVNHFSYASVGTTNHRVRTVVNLSVATLTGAGATARVHGRMTDPSNWYAAFLSYATSGQVTLQLSKNVAGVGTALGSGVVIGTFANLITTQIGIEFWIRGNNLYAKAWDISTAEPMTWTVQTSDTDLLSGTNGGVSSRRETSNTNAGLQVAFDTFEAAITAISAVEQDVYPPRVLVTVTDAILENSIELYRVVGGERTLVRAGSDDSLSDTAFLRIDAELPFGVPVSYVAVLNGAFEFTAGPTTYTLPGGKVVLSDAISGAAAEVVIMAWPEQRYDRQSSVFKVGGRNVVVSGPLGQFAGDIELYTDNTSSSAVLKALVESATEGVVQIRQPGGYDDVDCYVAVTGYARRRFSQDGTDPRRIHALSATETEGWAPLLEARGFTLQDIADAYDGLTLADLADDYATLLDLAQGDFS